LQTEVGFEKKNERKGEISKQLSEKIQKMYQNYLITQSDINLNSKAISSLKDDIKKEDTSPA